MFLMKTRLLKGKNFSYFYFFIFFESYTFITFKIEFIRLNEMRTHNEAIIVYQKQDDIFICFNFHLFKKPKLI